MPTIVLFKVPPKFPGHSDAGAVKHIQEIWISTNTNLREHHRDIRDFRTQPNTKRNKLIFNAPSSFQDMGMMEWGNTPRGMDKHTINLRERHNGHQDPVWRQKLSKILTWKFNIQPPTSGYIKGMIESNRNAAIWPILKTENSAAF